jgi:transcriptional regulator with XRE-family HTH domain
MSKLSKGPSWGTRISDILIATGLTAQSLASLLNVDHASTLRWLRDKRPDNGNVAVLVAIEHAIKGQKDLGPLRRKLHMLSACGGVSYLMFQSLKDPSDLGVDDLSQFLAIKSDANKETANG